MKPISITFVVSEDDVETAIAVLQADGKRVTKASIREWVRHRYASFGLSDVNSDLLSEVRVDLEYDEDAWQAVLATKKKIFG